MTCGEKSVIVAASMDSRQTLLTVARAYSDATGLSLARIATIIHNGGALFKKLDAGGTCTIETYDKAMFWFSEWWPTDKPWPEGIPRPSINPEPERECA